MNTRDLPLQPAAGFAPEAADAGRARRPLPAWLRHERVILLLIMTSFGLTTGTAMRHTSATFDEVLLPSAGARGYVMGEFDLVTDHPPLLQYIYGLPVWLSGPDYPAETDSQWTYSNRYRYAQAFFWRSGNDPERLLFLARLPAVIMGVLLIFATYRYTRGVAGPGAALSAGALVAFVPDVLAHSGISYNDVPLALMLLLACWAIDAAARRPELKRVLLAGIMTGMALGVKFSAIALFPITAVLLVLEAIRRLPDRRWLMSIAVGVPAYATAIYSVLVVVYLGDFALRDFWFGLEFNIRHANLGHGAPAVLLGQYSVTGWWYFFPVVFFLKTSAGMHALLASALIGLFLAPSRMRWRELLASPLRMPFVAACVLLAFVIAAKLNIGFRHALPIIPFACILIAYGMRRVWTLNRPVLRVLIGAALVWHVVSPLRVYPYFLSYLSEYTGPEEYSYETLVDSNLDWGQGLLALRDFIQEEEIPRIYLSYFGSALPEGYGIRYVPLVSFFPLPQHGLPPDEPAPEWIAISATNMAGNYLPNDPFAALREVQPYRVLARSIFIFNVGEGSE